MSDPKDKADPGVPPAVSETFILYLCHVQNHCIIHLRSLRLLCVRSLILPWQGLATFVTEALVSEDDKALAHLPNVALEVLKKQTLFQPHTQTIRARFDRARSIACESLVCAVSIAYDLIACRAIASDQDNLNIIECSDDDMVSDMKHPQLQSGTV